MRLFNSLGLAYMFVSVFVLCMFILIVVTDKIEKYAVRKMVCGLMDDELEEVEND